VAVYFAHISQRGAIRHRDVPGSIGVLGSLDNFMPIGEAHCATCGEDAVWRIIVHGHELPGRWVIIDREFRPARQDGRQPRE
jgi:hypothetical protein